MRYQSAPLLSLEKQETTKERAARHRRERQEELSSMPSNEAQCTALHEKVLAGRVERGEERATKAEVDRSVTNWLFKRPATAIAQQNIIMDGVYIWVETTKTGHAFISTFENGNHTLYSYGRYDNIDGFLTGEGVLVRYIGNNAIEYMKVNLYKYQAQVYLITDVTIAKVKDVFDGILSASDELPDSPKTPDRVKQNGKVVDRYDLTGNNCTTYTVDSLKKADSRVFNTDWLGVVKYSEDFMIPSSLMDFLNQKSDSFSMNVINMTHRFKDKLDNSNGEAPEDKGLNPPQSLGTSGRGVGYIGQSSGYSGGTSGGSF
ncbi:hypothetical protein [Photobacterium nomapromontoriensis]|uniref:hypothetical protein n=1 Tax=Photobacterium nomapromontoriensis TaxID=2910237 RepID=UPI003D1094F5